MLMQCQQYGQYAHLGACLDAWGWPPTTCSWRRAAVTPAHMHHVHRCVKDAQTLEPLRSPALRKILGLTHTCVSFHAARFSKEFC